MLSSVHVFIPENYLQLPWTIIPKLTICDCSSPFYNVLCTLSIHSLPFLPFHIRHLPKIESVQSALKTHLFRKALLQQNPHNASLTPTPPLPLSAYSYFPTRLPLQNHNVLITWFLIALSIFVFSSLSVLLFIP